MKGSEVKERRIKLGLTQKELADETGFHQSAIGRWESGDKALTRGNALIIEDYFKKKEKFK